jgi:hypothetical protein
VGVIHEWGIHSERLPYAASFVTTALTIMKKLPVCLLLLLAVATNAAAVDYKTQIAPIFRAKCYECHSEPKGKTKGDLAMEPDDKLAENIGPGKHIVPGEPAKSTMLIFAKLPDDDDEVMPPKGKNRMTPAETALLETWIKEGASLTGGGTAAAPPAPASSPPAPAAAEGAPQKWTNAEGVVIDAIFMGLKDDGVLLKIPTTGVTHIVPLAKLSPESQAQAKKAGTP